MKSQRKLDVLALGAVAALWAISACSKPNIKQVQTQVPPPPPPAPVAVSTPPVQQNLTEASLRMTDFAVVPNLKTIHFAFDKSNLSSEARTILKANADYLKAHAQSKFRIAGYCDPRGTEEYNLALGQRRAKAVRDYYINLGVSPDLLATISYGKENLACAEKTKTCYARCRRGVTEESAPAQAAETPETAQPAGQ
jgi:peptidoglycan-associated lipoprotein